METIYTYTWTPKEGRALIRQLEKYLKAKREQSRKGWRTRRRNAKRKRLADGGASVAEKAE